jgi:Wadjet protein JetD, C-terminal
MTPATVEDFLHQLLEVARGRKRVVAHDYRQVFAKMCPILSPPEARTKLAGWLSLLVETDDIVLPKGRRLYDRSGSGDLPAWVELVRPGELTEQLPVDPEIYAWAPELRFACTIHDARQLHILLRVQQFLADGGRQRPLIPVKERSVELFGKEKRLEMMRNGTLFLPGRLSFELLRCFPVPPPMVWESSPADGVPRPVIVLENHSTYHSFHRWNQDSRVFAAVVYGSGDALKTSAPGLAEVVRSLSWDGRFFYFGDIDPEGFLIPLAASAALSTVELSGLTAHRGCYLRLLERANHASLPSGGKLALPQGCKAWLGNDLASKIEDWFDRGVRVPQELVGWDQLVIDGAEFARV